jgi:cytochrome bd ubiquinol oxidase subunit II
MIGATLLLVPLWIAIRRDAIQSARILVATQVGLILIGWFRLQFPVIINSRSDPLTIYAAAAPEPTLRYLLYAIIAGSAIIFPALVCLLKIFKVSDTDLR